VSHVPPGYRSITCPDGTRAVARAADADDISLILREATLHEWAAAQRDRRALRGRGVAWAVSLPGGSTVVVRHSMHGGMLASLTGDRFLAPTRAPHELEVACWLRSGGVRTPEVAAYATYPAGPLLRRSDVATVEIPDARDLGEYCRLGGNELDDALELTRELVESLSMAGAHHPDLNVKNVLIGPDDGRKSAWVLDVDRVRRTDPRDAMSANVRRLVRSLNRWRTRHSAPVTHEQVARIAALGERS
jgi:hypothetical protein